VIEINTLVSRVMVKVMMEGNGIGSGKGDGVNGVMVGIVDG